MFCFVGPAKIWAMRGKYRQTFLRISQDGVETGAGDVNLRVDKDKTLAVVVETVSTRLLSRLIHSSDTYLPFLCQCSCKSLRRPTV